MDKPENIIYVGWNKNRFFEFISILRCFNCCKFGNRANQCTNLPLCLLCARNYKKKNVKPEILRVSSANMTLRDRSNIYNNRVILGVDLAHFFHATALPEKESKLGRHIGQHEIFKCRQKLIFLNWEFTSTNVDVLYENFMTNITETFDPIAPPVEIKFRKRKQWIDKEVEDADQQKNNFYKKVKFSNSGDDFENYRKQRNNLDSIIRRKQKLYYEQLIRQLSEGSEKNANN
ncbi:hypothetical protein WA026_019782 [Henosepilachna vigintioctopunctata]|uniref:CCHC-type domain-containing protein n=1 Tax=Henosepilachna vigintioctopunctata TaxID=420089 RepID=A0AAW1VAW2_9CUCU